MINILGVSAYYHDSAAALIQDGRVIAAAQEERFTRVKHDAAFPANAIEYCLREAGLGYKEINYLTFYERPSMKFERLAETYVAFAPKGRGTFEASMPIWSELKLRLPERMRAQLPGFAGEIQFIDHHESHAASAFFPSPFEEAAILTLDAVGEWSTSTMGVGRGNGISLSNEMRFPHSLGMLYSAFTWYTGFRVGSGEYKLMGLAPYGRPVFADRIRDHIAKVLDDGSLWLDQSYFSYCESFTMTSEKFHELFGGPPRSPEDQIEQRHMDLAASIQLVCEEVVLKAAKFAHRSSSSDNLVMAGGVALNCVANGRLLREGPFKRIWIQPAAGDAGGSLGSALLFWHRQLGNSRTPVMPDGQAGSLLGPRFSNAEIRLFLDSVGAHYEFLADEPLLLQRVAQLIEDGNVVGWFQGRMEFGPRALGCRSIIGDPRSPMMQQKMNVKIKFRESFRPFAPCILAEHAHEVFDISEGEESPYMLQVAPVRDTLRAALTDEQRSQMADPDLRVRVNVPRSTLPAITHVDYSARLQTVDSVRHGRLYHLMKEFQRISGCPVVVNTSFNIRGEPIVCTPEDAYRCFLATDMDCLVLENHVLLKERQTFTLLPNIDSYRRRYAEASD
jgi:carbamoyltransferase